MSTNGDEGKASLTQRRANFIPRPKPHWNARYVRARAALSIWQRRNPEAPWLVRTSIDMLGQWLQKSDVVVEFGSGRSTHWFAGRAGHVVSVEHHKEWYNAVTEQLKDKKLDNVEYVLAEDEPERYANAGNEALDRAGGKAHLILVDGKHRDACLLWALDRIVQPGGLIVLDNANRYIPSDTVAPASVKTGDRPPTAGYAEFIERTKDWRRAWFGDGVTETLVYFVP